MLLRPTRVRAKPVRFHISAYGYVKNAPDFTLPNKDTPESCPILDPNHRRGYLRGVCFCALHGYMKNPVGFIFPHPDTPKTHPVLYQNLRRETFRGVCNTPLHGYMQIPPDFRRKSLSQDISGRMLLRPTRVRAKFVRFHISASEYAKNAPRFTLPNRVAPKTHPVLDLNLRRGAFRGVCFCALHGYVQNLAGFGLKPSAQDISGRMQYAPTRVHPKNCLVSYFRTRIHQKRTRFYHPK